MGELTRPLIQPPAHKPRVVIIGGGFAGLHAAIGLAHLPVEVTVVDRRNHHTFQPLLYQVALAVLSPADIAQPIRSILRRQKNTQVLMDEVVSIDVGSQRIAMASGAELPYDYLVLAAGATHSYFGHDDWATFAPGLKTIEDATEIRRRVYGGMRGGLPFRDERLCAANVAAGTGPNCRDRTQGSDGGEGREAHRAGACL